LRFTNKKKSDALASLSSSGLGGFPTGAAVRSGEVDPLEDQREIGGLDRVGTEAPVAGELRMKSPTLEALVPHPELQPLRTRRRALCG
jgi:hypothetical protein